MFPRKGTQSVMARSSGSEQTNKVFQEQRPQLEFFDKVVTYEGSFNVGDTVDIKSVFDNITRAVLVAVTRCNSGEIFATVATLPGNSVLYASSNSLCRG